jgi:tetratricopeptide (TPR) repeat protein
MKPIRILVVFGSIVLGLAGGVSLAGENPLRFLHALQENGYGDMAVEYLRILDKRPDLPPEIRQVWDLEMARSLKLAAGAAFDAKEYEALMEESQRHLAKFIKEKPDHPDATIAMAAWGDFLVRRALESLRLAKTVEGKDKQQYAKHLSDAREGLANAQGKFQQAEKKFTTRLAELPPVSKLPTRRAERNEAVEAHERAESNLYESQFQLALIDYYLAQTYADPKSADRIAMLKKAAQAFDDIYQRNRGSVTGLYAHMWHGKTTEELGDLQTALDIYDEVLANAPEPTEKGPATGLEPLFTQVEQFRLIIVAKKNPRQFLPEATSYLKEYRRLRQTEGYQGIARDTAKAMLALAEKATGAEKKKLMGDLREIVTDGSKVRSQYQQELYAMRRQILKMIGGNLEVNSFDDGVAAGDAAVATADWEKALQAYNTALEIAEKTKLRKPKEIATVREAVARVQFMMACDLFNKGKLSECIELAGKIVRDPEGQVKKESTAAAQASALGVSAALNLYVTAPNDQKPAALERLMKVAEFTEKNWPDKPEADDARMARGQAKIAVGQVREAIDVFDRVNPKSERYATAMYWAGQNYWRLYVTEKFKRQGVPDKNQMAANRAKTIERLTTALGILRKQVEPGKPLPKYMLEAQLLLAEVYNEGGEAKQAAALYQPLVELIKAEKPQNFDANTIRIFLGAVRAYSALNELDKAGAVSGVLIELGPDTLQINDVLVEFAKLLNLERKKAEARVTELENSANADEVDAAKKRLASAQGLLGKILVKLSQRQELGLGHMVFIGETLHAIGMTNEATAELQKILKRTETDPVFAKNAEKANSRIRSDLLMTLRQEGKYDDAMKQVEHLIKANPNALALLMEKGRILEAWAEKDPSKFDEAVKHWADVRNRLQGMPAKRRPEEYYEVMYNVAKCLVREAEKSQDKAKVFDCAKKAEQVLKSPMILNPKLNGPDTVAKYKVLLNKAIALQERSPDRKAEKKP